MLTLSKERPISFNIEYVVIMGRSLDTFVYVYNKRSTSSLPQIDNDTHYIGTKTLRKPPHAMKYAHCQCTQKKLVIDR